MSGRNRRILQPNKSLTLKLPHVRTPDVKRADADAKRADADVKRAVADVKRAVAGYETCGRRM